MPRPTNTVTRREQIIDGLMTVMSEVGYDGATISHIAAAAGLTPGLIHYHFQNKQSILIALITHLGTLLQNRLPHPSRLKTADRELAAFIDAHVGLGRGADTRAVACWIAIGAEAVRQPEVRSAYQNFTRNQLTKLEEICARSLAEAKRLTAKKREIALAILCAIEGAYNLTVSAPDLIVPGFAAPAIKKMASGLLAAEPRSKR